LPEKRPSRFIFQIFISLKKILYIYFLVLFTLTIKADWVQINNGLTQLNVNALTVSTSGGVNYLWAGTSPSFNGGGVFLSTNDGVNWSLSFNDNNYEWALATTINGGINYIFAGSSSSLVYTTNNGSNWNYTIFPNGSHWFYSLAANGNNIFAGCKYFSNDHGGIYKSTNYGSNWIQTSLTEGQVNAIAINGNYIFAGLGGGADFVVGVFVSSNYGISWTETHPNSGTFLSLATIGNYVFAGGGNGVYLSTNNGSNWTQTSLNNGTIQALLINGSNIFAGGYVNGGFFVSTNNGTSWIQRSEGGVGGVRALCISNNFIFAGTDGGGIYRRPLSEIVGIRPISEEVPQSYELKQNYPNPFNPSTKIKFAIPSNAKSESSTVKLIILDILGREIATPVNEKLHPGTYEVEWNAFGLSSGTYFYSLIANNSVIATRKFILIK